MYNPADSTIRSVYSYGDNVHLNNAGHKVLFEKVIAKQFLTFPIYKLLVIFEVMYHQQVYGAMLQAEYRFIVEDPL